MMGQHDQNLQGTIGNAQRRYYGGRVLDRITTEETIREKDTQYIDRSQRKNRQKQASGIALWKDLILS
jgi:hypothetical protein